MYNEIKVKKADVRDIVEVTFPEYRGRTFRVVVTDSITFSDTNWGGGSRSYYKFVRRGGDVAALSVPAPWNNGFEGKRVEMKPDYLVVEHVIFCGKDCGIRIYAHPQAMPRLIEG